MEITNHKITIIYPQMRAVGIPKRTSHTPKELALLVNLKAASLLKAVRRLEATDDREAQSGQTVREIERMIRSLSAHLDELSSGLADQPSENVSMLSAVDLEKPAGKAKGGGAPPLNGRFESDNDFPLRRRPVRKHTDGERVAEGNMSLSGAAP